jgi:hypothetical protein
LRDTLSFVPRGCVISNAAGNQAAIANNAASTDASNAASSFGSASGDIGTYLSNVNSTLAEGNPFESKSYLTNQNLETSGAMNSENDAEKSALENTVAKTGTNSAALANTVASSARQGQRDLTQYNAGRDTANENTWLGQQDKLLGDEATGASEEAGLYGSSVGAQDSALGTAQQGADAEEAANDQILDSGLSAGGAVGAAFCPAKGSLYLLPGGREVPVETLKVGDLIVGIDDDPQTIEEIQVGVTPILRIETEDGFVARNSRTHAYALPVGGFVVAIHALGKTILTAKGRSKVVSVTPDGEELAYNVITDGSHTYRADGIWALGVGEAERMVDMNTWNRVGDHLAAVK